MSERVSKVNELIRKEVGTYIQANLSRHKGLLTITAVETAPDMKNTKVWYSYVGHDLGSVKSELSVHVRDIQRFINDRMAMKSVPRIRFVLDHSGDYAQNISKLIDESI